MENMSMGRRIAALRKENGYTQEQLAAKLGISNQAVSKWEGDLNYPDILLLPTIADLFGISIDELFGREPIRAAQAEEENGDTKPIMEVTSLPWEDDGVLRAVAYVGHTLYTKKDIGREGHIYPNMGEALGSIELRFTGRALSIESVFDVNCSGSNMGNIAAGGDVKCEGDVGGKISCGGDVECGSVNGDIKTGGDVEVKGDIRGSVTCGGSIECSGNIEGKVIAGGKITCNEMKAGPGLSGIFNLGKNK